MNVTGTTRVTEEISSLPLVLSGDSRDAVAIARTMSGVNWTVQNLDYQSISRGMIEGAPQGQAGYYVDGVPAGVSGNELGEDFFNQMPEAVAEVRVSANDTPEFGWNSGATVSITTRSGTNQLHGDAFEYVRNDALDARNFFARSVSADKQNEFGVAIGGPVVLPIIYNGKDRTFFFATYDGFRYHFTGNRSGDGSYRGHAHW
jgi:hypothetical protein